MLLKKRVFDYFVSSILVQNNYQIQCNTIQYTIQLIDIYQLRQGSILRKCIFNHLLIMFCFCRCFEEIQMCIAHLPFAPELLPFCKPRTSPLSIIARLNLHSQKIVALRTFIADNFIETNCCFTFDCFFPCLTLLTLRSLAAVLLSFLVSPFHNGFVSSFSYDTSSACSELTVILVLDVLECSCREMARGCAKCIVYVIRMSDLVNYKK